MAEEEETLTIPEQIAKLKRSRNNYKGQITKAHTRMKAVEKHTTPEIDPFNIDTMLESTRNTMRQLEGIHESLTTLDPDHEAEHDKEWDATLTAMEPVQDALIARTRRGHACIKLERIQQSLDSFVMDSGGSSQQQTNQLLRHEKQRDDLQDEFYGTIRQDIHLKGLLAEITVKLGRLNSQLPDIEEPVSTAPRGSTEARPRDVGIRSYHHRKLPTISIPTFKGDILEWDEFWSVFNRNVHSNPELDDEERRAYLRQAVKDPSQANLIDSLAGSYADCVTSLTARYSQPRKLHQHHTKVFFSCPPCKDSSKKELSRILASQSKARKQLMSGKFFNIESVMESYTEGLLPPDIWREWTRQERDNQTVPKMTDLLEFLEFQVNLAPDSSERSTPRRERSAEKPERNYDRSWQDKKQQPHRGEVRAVTVVHPCLMCKDTGHKLYGCPKLLAQTVDQRTEFVTKAHLCFNCLCPNHDKQACKSTYRCRTCNKPHHTLLHRERPAPQYDSNDASATRVNANVVTLVPTPSNQIQETLSPTLSLVAHSPSGRETTVTALYDTGADLSFITNQTVNQLGLQKRKCNVTIMQALGTQQTKTNLVDLKLTSRHVPGEVRELTAVVVSHLGGGNNPLTTDQKWKFLSQLPLANPDFRQRKKLDLILGQDVLNRIGLRGQEEGATLTAHETIWGWTVQGPVGRPQRLPTKETTATSHCTSTIALVALTKLCADKEGDDLLRVFFQSEALDEELTPTQEDQAVLDHFESTHQILPGGRFQVSLPRRQDRKELGASRGAALRRYLQNEKSLVRRKALQPFQRVMGEYFSLHHAEVIPQDELHLSTTEHYYMPLHAVSKETSTTTKLRVVFDASAITSSGASLNDTLMTGPTVHPPLTDILMRFRMHRIGITADISKMYREISLDPRDRDLHRFLWREAPEDPIQDCRMRRVTFGVASSPFMATQTLQQIACNNQTKDPEAAHSLRTEFYVDDLLTGAETVSQAIHLQQQIQQLLGGHQLTLRKWRSSSVEVMEQIPIELHEEETFTQPYGNHQYLKTLGVQWNAQHDQFHVSISDLNLPSVITKRALASDVARTFDILGWFSPATLTMKALIQRLWAAGMDWDDPVPPDVQIEWSGWREQLPLLAEQPIARPYFRSDQGRLKEVSLHGFSDASLKGYAAVVYIRATYSSGPPTISMVQAKTKVAPLKGLTVPRLELCGAQLLASLITTIRTALEIPLENIQCWTDSQIVLFWLDGQTRTHRTFVANRVRRTLDKVPHHCWMHVPGKENPADCASRGITPGALRTHDLWWHGPDWLAKEPIQTPPQPSMTPLNPLEEVVVKKTVAAATTTTLIEERYSTYTCLRRTLAWMFRFTRHCKKKAVDRNPDKILTVADLEEAERALYRRAQRRMIHGNSMEAWQRDKRIRSLNPTKDQHGIFRVNGRLQNSPLEYAQRYPIILEGKDILTRRIIMHHHFATGHAGPTLLMSTVGRNHYIIQGLATVKATCRNCVTCKRFRAQTESQLMGQLPEARVTPGRPFAKVGTDFAGPLTLKKGHTRRPLHVKAYVCAFVCMVTKAVHLEVVSDLTTPAFMSCLTRFVGRRGLPTDIFSDNGTNFVGASRELDHIYSLMRTEETKQAVAGYCTECHIQWHFNPARAPHFGGLWEAAIKSFKLHFRRMASKLMFDFEEMSTILCRIEASLNSRPLMPLHMHSTEGVDVLTPGHFLIGQPLNALPEQQIQQDRHPRSRFILCQQLAQQFWQRWSQDYIRQLHHRTKWQKQGRDVAVGDIALIRGEATYPVNDWPMARVTNLYKGGDGLVRAVDLCNGTRTFRRPIAKLTILVRSDGVGSRIEDVPLPPAGMSESKDSDTEEI